MGEGEGTGIVETTTVNKIQNANRNIRKNLAPSRHCRYTDGDLITIREQWKQHCSKYFDNQSDKLPLLWEINHRIPLIDNGK